MEVAMVEAVLKSSMGRMRRRSRPDVHEAGAGEVGDVVGEREMRIEVTPRLRTGASEVKEVEDELSERCIEGSGIFLIWPGRPIMMNSVLEGLRRRRLGVICIEVMIKRRGLY